MKRILLVDLLGTCFVRYHRKDTAFVKNVMLDLQRIKDTYAIDKIILLREGGSKYRNTLHPGYKAARKERRAKATPAEKKEYQQLLTGVDRLVGIVKLLGIESLHLVGAEADDLAGYLCATLDPEQYQVMLLSEDSDWSQLLCRKNTVQGSYKALLNAEKWDGSLWYSCNRYTKEKGITPEQAFQIKQLTGDKADSIPGVDGVGDVGAAKLIEKYGSLQGVLENRRQLDIPRLTAKAKEAFLTCDEALTLGFELMNLRWDYEQWIDILNPSDEWLAELEEKLTSVLKPRIDLFTELCYENGWLELLENGFLTSFAEQ